MKPTQVTTNSSEETQKFAKKFAKQLKGGEILALVGELGSGKTTFVQGLADGLGVMQRINSPTFIIMRQYQFSLPTSTSTLPLLTSHFYHIDLYRLEGDLTDEVRNLGLDDIFGKEDTVVAIEWAEKIKNLLPKDVVWVKFEMLDNDAHRISYINI